MKTKAFNAVKYMRDTRDKLSRKYLKNPEAQDEDLVRIRKKYSRFKSVAARKRAAPDLKSAVR